MIRLTLDDRAVQQALNGLSRRVSDMTPVMNRITQVMGEGTRTHFVEEGGPGGARWKPLAGSTLLAYMRRSTGGKGLLTKRGNTRTAAVRALAQKKILLDSGRLEHDIGRAFDSMSAMLTTVQPYAATHQFGDEKRGIPARPFFGFSEAIKAGIIDAVTKHLDGDL